VRVETYDLVVIGGGPGGQKAAVEGAKAGWRVALVEQERQIGGSCVYRGTIPSKTLRASAEQLYRLRTSGTGLHAEIPPGTEISTLMTRMVDVLGSHRTTLAAQLEHCGVEVFHGKGRLADAHTVQVTPVRGEPVHLQARFVVVATGSRPRNPPNAPVDHEHVFDSDSILSMVWLPRSLTVVGGGVIGSEYACIFAALGVEVTQIDRGGNPLPFLEPEVTDHLLAAFAARGIRYLPHTEATGVAFDGVHVRTTLSTGEVVESEKVLAALGRLANTDRLGLDAIGVEMTKRGHIVVDPHGRSSVPHIYGVGDVIGFPSLASAAMEQGRRAIRDALGDPLPDFDPTIPMGIYTLPEASRVGLTEAEAREKYGAVCVGTARYGEVSRAHILGAPEGLLKLVASPDGTLVGVHIAGEGATELVHIGQMAMVGGLSVEEAFLDRVFNFPTLAEAYRIAALDLVRSAADPRLRRAG
jgi:NAD(P) transhydrogenase